MIDQRIARDRQQPRSNVILLPQRWKIHERFAKRIADQIFRIPFIPSFIINVFVNVG
jgi:hypothetical protein